MLVRGRWHLHCDDRTAFDPASLVKLVGMRTSKLGRDFRLANIRITLQKQARHPVAAWRLKKALKLLQGLRRAGIIDPAVAKKSENSFVVP
jgi:hypothetical protein